MKKILFLFVALVMSAASAWAFEVGNYTIKPYSDQTKYVVPSASWAATGADMAAYSSDAFEWYIRLSDDAQGYTISRASDKGAAGDIGYLNPWNNDGSNVSPIGCWKTNNGDDRWTITAVEGHDGVYTIMGVGKTCYMYYKSDASLLYYNNPAAPEETNWFVLEKVEAPAVFPEAGTYFVTFTGQATDGRNNCLYNDLTQADGYTLQAASQPSPVAENNNFIWKAVCDGTNMTIVNGQGSTMKLNNNSGDRTFNVINYVAHSGNYYLKPVLSEGTLSSNGHNCLNVSNGSYKNAANTPCLTSWSTDGGGANAGDNHWAVNVVDVTGLNEYTVTVTGAAGYVNYGVQKAANGGFFLAASIAEGDLTASAVSGMDATVTVSGTTISVVYTEKPGLNWDAYQEKIDQLKEYEGKVGTALGQYSIEIGGYSMTAEMFEYILEEYQSYLDEEVYTEAEKDDFDFDMEQMQAYYENLTLNMPKANTFLRIKDADSKYMTCENISNKTVFSTELNDKSIYCYTGSALIAYTNGFYASRYSNKPCGMTAVTTPSEGTLYHIHASSYNKGKYLVSFGGDTRFMYKGADAGNYAGGPTTVKNAGYEFTLEEVTSLPVSVSAAGFATLYAPVALTIPAGVKAYTLTEEGDYLLAAEVATTIPANTAVVLGLAEEAEAGTYNFAITTAEAFEGQNVLQGTVPAIAKVADALVLGLDDEDKVGFYTPADGVANFAGFKAYYVAPAASNGLRISFGELTSIISAAKENGGQAIFDLQGRRVVKAQNGLFIQNGKKVIK